MISPELLRRYPFFNFMDGAQLKAVSMIAEELTYEKDEVILEAGKPANHFFFLIDGDAAYYALVTSRHDPSYKKEYFVSEINPGEIFGISALIEPFVYTATLKADKVSRVIQIKAAPLRALCEADMKLSCGLHRAVAKAAIERLNDTRTQLVAVKT
jgi:CRP-like cAMP-binding protein